MGIALVILVALAPLAASVIPLRIVVKAPARQHGRKVAEAPDVGQLLQLLDRPVRRDSPILDRNLVLLVAFLIPGLLAATATVSSL